MKTEYWILLALGALVVMRRTPLLAPTVWGAIPMTGANPLPANVQEFIAREGIYILDGPYTAENSTQCFVAPCPQTQYQYYNAESHYRGATQRGQVFVVNGVVEYIENAQAL